MLNILNYFNIKKLLHKVTTLRRKVTTKRRKIAAKRHEVTTKERKVTTKEHVSSDFVPAVTESVVEVTTKPPSVTMIVPLFPAIVPSVTRNRLRFTTTRRSVTTTRRSVTTKRLKSALNGREFAPVGHRTRIIRRQEKVASVGKHDRHRHGNALHHPTPTPPAPVKASLDSFWRKDDRLECAFGQTPGTGNHPPGHHWQPGERTGATEIDRGGRGGKRRGVVTRCKRHTRGLKPDIQILKIKVGRLGRLKSCGPLPPAEGGLTELNPIFRFTINHIVFPFTHGNNHNRQHLIEILVHQTITCIAQFNLVAIRQSCQPDR